MWPFSKTQATEQKVDPLVTAEDAAIGALKEWRDVGEEFTYLGRTMRVTAHYRISLFCWSICKIPCIQAEYVDDNGVIRQAMFSVPECEALIVQQPNKRYVSEAPHNTEKDGKRDKGNEKETRI
jgi:hypothetical protein